MGFYDEIAKGYDELYKEEQLKKLSAIKDYFNPEKHVKMLDVGCASGISSEFDCFVVGVDPSHELLELNKNQMKIEARAENLPFKNESFDIIICLSAIHNFENIEKSLNEFLRVGKKKFIISILKKSKNLVSITILIKAKMKVIREIDEGTDLILFAENEKP